MNELEKKKVSQKHNLQKKPGINIGHLTHIENGTRKPSHKALKTITNSLGVPYQPLFDTYDKELDEKQNEYNYINYITYNQVPLISEIDYFVDCPANFSNASFAYRIPDNSMSPTLRQNSYAFIEVNGLIKHREMGLFRVNGEFFIRKLLYRRDRFILKANDKKFKDIIISDSDDFQIIGKVYL